MLDVIRKTYGEVVGLPDPIEGTIYIVSALVAQLTKDRNDLYLPGNIVRDSRGKIIGCLNLCKI